MSEGDVAEVGTEFVGKRGHERGTPGKHGQDAGFGVGLEHHRAGAIAEQHAGAAVGPVHDPAEGFRPDHQHPVGLTRADQPVRVRQRKDEAGADRLHVIGKAAGHPQPGLHHRGDGRKGQVGGRSRHDDRVDVVRALPGAPSPAAFAGSRPRPAGEATVIYSTSTGRPSEPPHLPGARVADDAVIGLDRTGRNPEVEEVLGALSLMTRRRIRHLPVVEAGAVVGIVSIGDLVKYRIDRIEAEARAMRDYIQQA